MNAKQLNESVAESWIKVAKEKYPDLSFFDRYLHGTTYVPLDVAIELQEELDDEQLIKVSISESNSHREIVTKRNWPLHLFSCQKFDQYKFGFPFCSIPSFKGLNRRLDFRTLWCLCAMLTRVEELWKSTNYCLLKESTWYGWILLWISKRCVNNAHTYITSKENPFKYNDIKTYESLLSKLMITSGGCTGFSSLHQLFQHHSGVRCLRCISDIEHIDGGVQENVLIFDSCDDVLSSDNQFKSEFFIYDDMFELRCVICINKPLEERLWDGLIVGSHGGIFRGNYWIQHRSDSYPIQYTQSSSLQFCDYEKYIAVYVRSNTTDKIKKRDIFMQSIGGQAHVMCKDHHIPLIRAKKDCKFVCCWNNRCKKAHLVCPEANCRVCLCKVCYERCDCNVVTHINDGTCHSMNNNGNQFSNFGAADPIEVDIASEAVSGLDERQDEASACSSDDDFNEDHALEAVIEEGSILDESHIHSEVCDGYSDSTLDYVDYFGLPDDVENYMTSSNPYTLSNCYNSVDLPTTNAGERAVTVTKHIDQGYGDFVNGHILLNGCASMLARKSVKLQPSLSQRHFIQRQVSVSPGASL